MSALALETSRFFYIAISRFFYIAINSIHSFFKIILETIVLARQEQANFEVAKLLHESGEFRSETFHYILKLVREGRIDELYSKKTL